MKENETVKIVGLSTFFQGGVSKMFFFLIPCGTARTHSYPSVTDVCSFPQAVKRVETLIKGVSSPMRVNKHFTPPASFGKFQITFH